MDMLNEIAKLLKNAGVKKQITLQTEFKDLGLDSLDLMELVINAESKYNLRVPDHKLMDIKTVDDLIKVLNDLKSGK